MAFLSTALDFLFLKETYAPWLLSRKAAEIRRETKNWGIHAKRDEVEFEFKEIMRNNFTRPLRMLFTEPMVALISLYMSFIYGLVYALVEAYPYAFQHVHQMNAGVSGLPLIGLIIGQVLACAFICSQNTTYVRKLKANDGVPIPEWRLQPTIIGAPAFTLGLFW
ncbi:hypothetical protein Plec18167_004979 [Paecilomyces lecythidis]|uniref:Uncharacterized protein n=1 Tax=Paecilomyces lecythidis TaxID=3004212 RepID=A0ABR3XNI0_9EURO